MVTVVVVLNTLIALINFYIAWRIWKLRRVVANAAKGILAAERSTYKVLHGAPNAISKGQTGVSAVRSRYQLLELQLKQLQQILGLLSLVGKVWQGRSKLARQPKSPKKVSKLSVKLRNK
ncbi:hypothetical protein [Argonema galeatum]|uniref:hypothetical protein n=1 Tax=Argonema galeatum TaxID=2942762 RepID=UPI00201136A0|nr:hypothetical protein [Argonema galeatum]MCL1468981.1 hypothetical protein [Argonema galeatum A003/A1]